MSFTILPRPEENSKPAEPGLLAHALAYAARGWPVFPCRPRGKEPLVAGGYQAATTDPATIREWWARWPRANIGVPTGRASGLVVIDVDPRNGGDAALLTLPPLPETVEVITGGGGRHLYFRAPNREIRSRPNALGPGVDLKAGGGYVLVPPSVHPTGRRYCWKAASHPDEVPIAPLPEWLVERLAEPEAAPATRAGGGRIREGQRNVTLASLAGSMRRRGMTREAIEAALLAENAARCDPPLPEGEVRQIARSVSRYAPALEEAEVEGQAAPGVPAWPDPPDEAAYHGLAGEVVRAIEPHSEADPVALLAQFLTAFGSAAGRSAHIVAEADRHFTNLFVCLVGATAKARKGSSWGHILRLFEAADPDWARARVQHGLSSGEGLIWAVRDAIARREPIKEKGRVTGYQDVEDDPGVADKRLLVVEAEFASVLKMATREGNTLSQVLRQAWDRGDLRTLVKHSPARATGAHISLIGHITREELLRYLDSTEAANGFANRFIWLCVRRSKVLPEGGRFHEVDVAPLVRRLRAALEFARTVDEVRRDEEARAVWREVYPALSEGEPGLLGAMIARAEAQVMRLALIYALLDGSAVIRGPHLDAALALWDYAEASARCVFGEALGDPVGDAVLDALKAAGEEGLARADIYHLFSRHVRANRVEGALAALAAAGLAHALRRETGGRPEQRWYYAGAKKAKEAKKAPTPE